MTRLLKRLLPLGLLLLAALGRGETETVADRRHASARVLRSDRLHVEVMDPAAPEPYYRGNRFSPVANVLRVTGDGRDFLYSPVKHDPDTENAGLAMEFDIIEHADAGPPGFASAGEGEPFLKVGVGVLRKTGGRYGFYKRYETLRSAPVEATWGDDFATFHQRCGLPDGSLAYRLDAEVRVRGRLVEISCRLENTGRKPFSTEQYAHNFFSLAGAPPGPGYQLELPREFSIARMKPELLGAIGRRAVFTGSLSPDEALNADLRLAPAPASDAENFRVLHTGNGMGVKVGLSCASSRIAVHAARTYLCAEQFVRLGVDPGETHAWLRRYEFEQPSPDAR